MSAYGYTFGRVPDGLLFSGASDRACRLYAILTRYADQHVKGDPPTRPQLAEFLGCSVDSLDRAVKEMVGGGWLEVLATGRYRLLRESSWRFQVPGRAPDQAGPRVRRSGVRKRRLGPTKRRLVMERDEYCCRHCGATEDLTIDHIVPESRGGSSDIDNLQLLCRICNSRKGVKLP